MKQVLHIVHKDFRHLRFYLAGWLGLVVLRAAVIGYGPLDSGTWDYDSFFYYELLAWFPQICLLRSWSRVWSRTTPWPAARHHG